MRVSKQTLRLPAILALAEKLLRHLRLSGRCSVGSRFVRIYRLLAIFPHTACLHREARLALLKSRRLVANGSNYRLEEGKHRDGGHRLGSRDIGLLANATHPMGR